jgi:hypothetical protein
MKKPLSLILAFVLCLSMCACGTSEEKESNEIKLTAENLGTYIRVEKQYIQPDTLSYLSATELTLGVEINGASSNYNYNNVSITYKVSDTWECTGIVLNEGACIPCGRQQHTEFTITVKTDISGYGVARDTYPASAFACDEHKDVINGLGSEYSWEIISVTGTLTPVG